MNDYKVQRVSRANPNPLSAMAQVMDTIAKYGGFDSDDALMRRLTREQGTGAIGARFHDLLGGFNRTQQGSAVPANTDMQGLTFFTRPNLNLSYDNVMALRQLSVLASEEPSSYSRIIRRMLWPDSIQSDIKGDNTIFDNRQAFMPLLSNTLTNMSGWPDLTLHAYSSAEGMAKEVWMMNDSIAEINGRFSLDCTFENTLGDPISLTLFAWILYIGGVYMGTKIQPAGYSIVQNEIDYMTRVYRFVMDWSGRFIQKWAICGAGFPTGLSMGTAFNYSRENPYNESNKSIQATFECTVAEYNDPLALWEFNKLVVTFNASMGDGTREKSMVKISPEERKLFNYKGFPWINMMNNNELEWWIDRAEYESVIKGNFDKTDIQPIENPNDPAPVQIIA
ncbi:hypothetical protein PA10_00196 [Pseudomonas phage pPa_SNUABM_DT01]|nr:hypothetical protein PA10_00196 [Pseudomonas phage pPa_SNUABM_DT01]